ncbi:hypothetical protein EXIGLDRAFT_721155 [Exidia glandulosa HHB12029]|uniref:Uncharacterized protein n=1 Tax=Exidia glandulosa HHB12029 TaxID=1314781 RepID=A0A166A911_EXIGL|nr:hypothetical protein EXIGLDRAFT_721155 [Exidia glandulosa HHB12029]
MSNKSNVGAISGAALGALVLIALGIGAILFLRRRRHRLSQRYEEQGPVEEFAQRDLEGARPVMIGAGRGRGHSPTPSTDPFSDDRAMQSTLPPLNIRSNSPVDFFAGVIVPSGNLSPQQRPDSRSMNPFADPSMPSPAVPSPKVRKDEEFRWSDLSSGSPIVAAMRANGKRDTVMSDDTAPGDVTWSYPTPLKPTNPDSVTSEASFAVQQSRVAPPPSSAEGEEVDDEFEMVTPRPFGGKTNPSAHVSVATSLASADPFVYDREREGSSRGSSALGKHVSTMTTSTDADPFVYDRVAARQRLSEMPIVEESSVPSRPPIPRVSIISATSVASGDLGYAV